MQTIYPVTLTPQEYVDQSFQKQVPKPENCTNCGAANCVEALGYYERWVSYLLEALRIWVRRFRCRQCKVSISCLPDFAQPYRVVNSATVQAGFNQETTKEVQHWGWLVEAYWKRFTGHLQDLLGAVGSAFGPYPVDVGPKEFWDLLVEKCTHLKAATQQLVQKFGTCLFGHYRCHQRKDFSK